MALVPCPDCGKQVSDQAASCIGCGRPLHDHLVASPAAGSAKAAEKGMQRAKWKHDLGNAIALIGICVAVVVGMASSFLPAILTALVFVALGVFVAYFS